jgi:hypothetical protein
MKDLDWLPFQNISENKVIVKPIKKNSIMKSLEELNSLEIVIKYTSTEQT